MESVREKQLREAERRAEIVIDPGFADAIRKAWGNSLKVTWMTLGYISAHVDFREVRHSDGFDGRIEELANKAKSVDDFIEDLRDVAVLS